MKSASELNNTAHSSDEINLSELVLNLWRQRGLIVGVTLAILLVALIFHAYKATFSVPTKVNYGVSLTFAEKGTYPNGSIFSPNDLVANQVVKNTLEKLAIKKPVEVIKSALSVNYSNSLLQQGEKKLAGILAGTKNPTDVTLATENALNNLRNRSKGFLTVSLDLQQAGLGVEPGRNLVVELVENWANTSIEKGLTTTDISRPFDEFKVKSNSSLIDSFEDATSYLKGLKSASSQLASYDGVNTIIVNGKTLEDMRRSLASTENTDLTPLRAYAYANSVLLGNDNPAIKIRLDSRERLLKSEHRRLTQQLVVHNKILDDLTKQTLNKDTIGKTSMRMSEASMDESFLNSMIDLGSTLSNVELRKMLITEILRINDELLNIEKEISILLGTNGTDSDAQPYEILDDAINLITQDLNLYTQQLNDFLKAYSIQIMQNTGRLYISDTGTSVSGGGIQLSKQIALHSALALVFGGMVGIFVALLRSAFISNRKELESDS